jgi:hypothetical protein
MCEGHNVGCESAGIDAGGMLLAGCGASAGFWPPSPPPCSGPREVAELQGGAACVRPDGLEACRGSRGVRHASSGKSGRFAPTRSPGLTACLAVRGQEAVCMVAMRLIAAAELRLRKDWRGGAARASSAPLAPLHKHSPSFTPVSQVRRQRKQQWHHVTALLSRSQPRAAVAAWPSSAPSCRSTPAPAQLLLGGSASRWRPGSWSRSAASPLCSTHARLCRFVCIEWGCRRQRRSLLSTGAGWWPPAAGCSRGLTSQHFSADPSFTQPSQRGRLQLPAAVLRQPLLSCFSVVAHRAGARVRGAALPHRLYAARTLA